MREADDSVGFDEVTEQLSEEIIDKQIAKGAPAEMREELKRMVQIASVCFTPAARVGCPGVLEHVIETGNAKPVCRLPYHTGVKENQIVREQVEEIEKAGIIERAYGPWAAGVVLVKKKGL